MSFKSHQYSYSISQWLGSGTSVIIVSTITVALVLTEITAFKTFFGKELYKVPLLVLKLVKNRARGSPEIVIVSLNHV